MNVWCHLPTIFNRRYVLRIAGLVALCVALITTLFFSAPSEAATGVNQTISFQARLTHATGGVIPDGYYNIQFKIYQDGDGTVAGNTAGSPGGTLKWTESYVNNGGTGGVHIKNGYMSVTLGSVTPFGTSVDWNQDTIWLSMNIAGSNVACTNFGTAPCIADGEMLPMKRMTATPYALNAGMLGGKTASEFLQNTDSLQTGSMQLSGAISSNTSVHAPELDTTGAGVLGIGTTNATGVTIGKAGTTTSIQGSLQVNDIDTNTATPLEIGSSNATAIHLNQDVTIAAGKSLTMTGGSTATRPASPTEGTLYYDTDTKQLLVYSNGKWQGDRTTSTKIVAASNAPQSLKDAADYVVNGTAEDEINSALTAAIGGKVYLTEGTYTVGSSINIPNNTTLSGAGNGTVITIQNGLDTAINTITNATLAGNGTNIVLQDLKLDGNKSNQTTGVMHGVYFSGLGSGTGAAAIPGATIKNVQSNNWRNSGIYLLNSSNNSISSTHTQGNGDYGISSSNGSYNTIVNNSAQGNTAAGIYLATGASNTITGNTTQGNTTAGISLNASSSNAMTGNTSSGNSYGIIISAGTGNTMSGNTTNANTNYGIYLASTSHNSVTGNTIQSNPSIGLYLNTAHNNTLTANKLHDNGGSTVNNAVYLSASDSNTITGNSITDTAATNTNYAINISNSTSDTNYLADNSLGGGSINNVGTGTVFGGQVSSAGNYVVQPAGTIDLMKNTNVTGTLTATTLSSGSITVSSIDTASAGVLTVGTSNATSINLAQNTTLAAGKTFAVNGTTSVTTTSSSAFTIQNASSVALFTADTAAQQVIIGSVTNGVVLSANGIQLKGTARNIKSILLTPEFAGSVLDAQNDSTCTTASSGTMTASYDTVGRMNYYNWTSPLATNQCYDVVVQVPIPADFSGWQSNSIMAKTSNTSNSSYAVSIIDSSGTYDTNYGSSYASPGSLSTSWTNIATSPLNGTYTAGDYFTIKFRMSSKNNANLQLGNIALYYYSDK